MFPFIWSACLFRLRQKMAPLRGNPRKNAAENSEAKPSFEGRKSIESLSRQAAKPSYEKPGQHYGLNGGRTVLLEGQQERH